MSIQKVSLSLDDELLRDARATAGPGELSAYVNEALRRQVERDRLAAYLDELDQEFGPVPDLVQREVDAEWQRSGDARRRRGSA